MLFHAGDVGAQLSALAELDKIIARKPNLETYLGATREHVGDAALLTREMEVLYTKLGISVTAMRNMRSFTLPGRELLGINPFTAEQGYALRFAQPAKCLLWMPSQAGLEEIGVPLKSPYEPPFKWTTALRTGVKSDEIYTGSALDADEIFAQCSISIPRS